MPASPRRFSAGTGRAMRPPPSRSPSRRAASPRSARWARPIRRFPPSICAAAWSCRASSTCIPISTRAISSPARRTPTAASSARARPSAPTARRIGPPPTSAPAWISRSAAPSPTARARSAPISTPSASRRRSAGPSSPSSASSGRAAWPFRPSRCCPPISSSTRRRNSAPSSTPSPARAAFSAR